MMFSCISVNVLITNSITGHAIMSHLAITLTKLAQDYCLIILVCVYYTYIMHVWCMCGVLCEWMHVCI